MVSNNTKLHVWDIIASVLKKQDPIVVLAFFGYFYFHHPPSRLAIMLDVSVPVITSWLSKIQTDIKRVYRETGGSIGPNGKTISATMDSILEGVINPVNDMELD